MQGQFLTELQPLVKVPEAGPHQFLSTWDLLDLKLREGGESDTEETARQPKGGSGSHAPP